MSIKNSSPIFINYPEPKSGKAILPQMETNSKSIYFLENRQLFKKFRHYFTLTKSEPVYFSEEEQRTSDNWILYGERTIQNYEFKNFQSFILDFLLNKPNVMFIPGNLETMGPEENPNLFNINEARFFLDDEESICLVFCKKKSFFIKLAWVFVTGFKLSDKRKDKLKNSGLVVLEKYNDENYTTIN